jgi:protocatechuate 3,4-dioxygenase beta subunit
MRLRSFAVVFLTAGSLLAAESPADATAILEGVVNNQTSGRPMPDVRISLSLDGGDPVYIRTDAQGRFAFHNLTAGQYRLKTERPGFLVSGEQSTLGYEAFPIDIGVPNRDTFLPRGVTVERSTEPNAPAHVTLTISLFPYAVISGTLTDPDGMPLANMRINLVSQEPGSQNPRTTPDRVMTDDLGRYRVARLYPGTYYVVAAKSETNKAWMDTWGSTWSPQSPDLKSASAVILTAGQQARVDIRIVRSAGVTVSGRLLLAADPDLLARARVALLPDPSPSRYMDAALAAISSDRFEFKDVLPGTYVLTALITDPHNDPFEKSSPLYGSLRRIQVAAAGATDMALELQTLASLRGTVVLGPGCSPGPISLEARGYNPISSAWAEVKLGAPGPFELSGLTPAHLTFSSGNFAPNSVHLGDRDVTAGFDYPAAAEGPLKIEVGCPPSGVRP